MEEREYKPTGNRILRNYGVSGKDNWRAHEDGKFSTFTSLGTKGVGGVISGNVLESEAGRTG